MRPTLNTRKFAGVGALVLAAAVLGCDAASGRMPTGPAATTFSLSLTPDEAAILAEAGITPAAPGDGEQGATGGVWYETKTQLGLQRAMLAFTAIKHRDDRISGEYEYRTETGVRLHGTVDCLQVSGNRATFSGPVTQPGFAGEQTFIVRDNGEGTTAPPDEVTGPVPARCDRAFESVSAGTVVQGNLQVHP